MKIGKFTLAFGRYPTTPPVTISLPWASHRITFVAGIVWDTGYLGIILTEPVEKE